MQKFGIQFEWTMTGHRRTSTSTRKELCTWCYACVVKCSWRVKPSCWTLRRPTPLTTWKPRSRETTRSTTRTLEHARSVAVFVVSSALLHSSLAHRTLAQDVCVCASFHPMVIAKLHAWVERSLWLPWPFHHLHLPPLFHHYSQAVPRTLQLHRG